MTKDLENVMNVLIGLRDNTKRLVKIFENENDDQMVNHYKSVLKEQNMILMMISDKKHLERIAEVYDVKLK